MLQTQALTLLAVSLHHSLLSNLPGHGVFANKEGPPHPLAKHKSFPPPRNPSPYSFAPQSTPQTSKTLLHITLKNVCFSSFLGGHQEPPHYLPAEEGIPHPRCEDRGDRHRSSPPRPFILQLPIHPHGHPAEGRARQIMGHRKGDSQGRCPGRPIP